MEPTYVDRQGMSVLHLAAMFNQTEIVFMLIDAGASVSARNGQGEGSVRVKLPQDCVLLFCTMQVRSGSNHASFNPVGAVGNFPASDTIATEILLRMLDEEAGSTMSGFFAEVLAICYFTS